METETERTEDVIEVQAERLPLPEEMVDGHGRDAGRRLRRAIGPVFAGFVIDVVDLSTFGALGVKFGMPIGGLCGYWLARELRVKPSWRFTAAVVSGVYCMFPPTQFFPVATLIGALARLFLDDPSDES